VLNNIVFEKALKEKRIEAAEIKETNNFISSS
jgi:hypothetical protein